MPNLLRMSEAASLALHSMAMLAAAQGRLLTRKDISEALNISEAHLTKVLQRLARVGLVSSERGPAGGFSLAMPPDRIRLIDVYEAIEGPLPREHCLLGKQRTCRPEDCVLGTLLQTVNTEGRKFLSSTTLADVAETAGKRMVGLTIPRPGPVHASR